jgi:hypothetical protein
MIYFFMEEKANKEREEQIREVLKDKLDVSLESLIPINQGVSTTVFNVNPDGENLYFRIQPIKDYAYSPVVSAHKLAAEKGILLPEVLYSEDFSKHFEGRSFMIIKSLKGNNLEEDTEVDKNVMFEAGKDLALLNTIPTDQFGWIERSQSTEKLYSNFPTLKDDLTNKLDERLDEYKKLGMLDNDQIKKINLLVGKLGKLIDFQPTLAHTDISYAHIFVNKSGYSGIIDFDDIRGSHWMLDLAEASHSLYRYDDYKNFLEGYSSIFSISPDQMDYEFRLIRLFWFIEKGYWVIDFNPDPFKNGYYKIMLKDLEFLS